MSENTEQVSDPHTTIAQATFSEMLMKNFKKLPDFDQKALLYGSLYLGGSAGLAGLIANSMFRKILNVQAAPFTSSLPMFVLPFLSTSAVFYITVSIPLVNGNLDCPSCAMTRGTLIGMIVGGLYPIVLAVPMSLALAARYSSAPLPEKGTMLRYFRDISKPVLKKMVPVLLLQAFFGSYLGFKQFQAYTRLARITFSNDEELHS